MEGQVVPALADHNEFADLVTRIQNGEEGAEDELYQLLNRGVRYLLARHLGPADCEDKLHDTFLIVVMAIRNRKLVNPTRLIGFVRTVVRRNIAGVINERVKSRNQVAGGFEFSLLPSRGNQELDLVQRERKEIAKQALRELSPRDSEILTRYYVCEQPEKQICGDMILSATEFRLLKSRAKARFGVLGRRVASRRLRKTPQHTPPANGLAALG